MIHCNETYSECEGLSEMQSLRRTSLALALSASAEETDASMSAPHSLSCPDLTSFLAANSIELVCRCFAAWPARDTSGTLQSAADA